MKYDPELHHRRSIRYRGYDYRGHGAYFVTICVQNRTHLFGHIASGVMHLSEFGSIVDRTWDHILQHKSNVSCPIWVVMPNHFHSIILINTQDTPAEDEAFQSPTLVVQNIPAPGPITVKMHDTGNAPSLQNASSGSLGAIIGNFKSVTTRQINKIRISPQEKVWQSNYFERIIRSEEEYHSLASYIEMNPELWDKDKYYES